MATALKVLFSSSDCSGALPTSPVMSTLALERNEVIALVNLLERFSASIEYYRCGGEGELGVGTRAVGRFISQHKVLRVGAVHTHAYVHGRVAVLRCIRHATTRGLPWLRPTCPMDVVTRTRCAPHTAACCKHRLPTRNERAGTAGSDAEEADKQPVAVRLPYGVRPPRLLDTASMTRSARWPRLLGNTPGCTSLRRKP